jgi:hypothetical protein
MNSFKLRKIERVKFIMMKTAVIKIEKVVKRKLLKKGINNKVRIGR